MKKQVFYALILVGALTSFTAGAYTQVIKMYGEPGGPQITIDIEPDFDTLESVKEKVAHAAEDAGYHSYTNPYRLKLVKAGKMLTEENFLSEATGKPVRFWYVQRKWDEAVNKCALDEALDALSREEQLY